MIGVLVLLAALAVVVHILGRSFGGWTQLPAFPVLYWLVAIAVPIAFAPSFPVSLDAVFYIFVLLAAWASSALVTLSFVRGVGLLPQRKARVGRLSGFRDHRKHAMALAFAGLTIGLASLRAQGHELSDVASVRALEALARENAGQRFREGIFPPVEFSLGLSFVYAAAGLNGVSFARRVNGQLRRSSLGLGIPILFALALGVVENSKATPLYAVAFFAGGYFSARAIHGSRVRALSTAARARFSFIMSGAVVLGGAALVIMQRMRSGLSGTSSAEALSDLRAWAFGHVGGFSFWYEELCCDQTAPLGLGRSSVSAVFRAPNAAPLQIPKPLADGLSTNVDTLFSELILDFGQVGAVALIAVLSALSVLLWVAAQRGSLVAEYSQILPYATVIWSFTTSLGNYTSCILAAGVIVTVARYSTRVSNGVPDAASDASNGLTPALS